MGNRHSGGKAQLLTEDLINELTRCTQMNRQQIEAHYMGFLKDCPNGLLTRKKLIKAYKSLMPDGNPTAIAKSVFQAIDENHDGVINFQEYMIALASIKSHRIEDWLTLAFRIYDTDGNGYLTSDELQKTLKAIERVNKGDEADNSVIKKRVKQIMQSCDLSRDNQISLDELITGYKAEYATQLAKNAVNDYAFVEEASF